MGGLFSGYRKKTSVSRITPHDEAVLSLKKQRDELKLYQKRILDVIERDRNLAKRLLAKGMKERALLLLRKKKFQESVLVKTDGQLDSVERLVHDLEFSQVELRVLDGLRIGAATLKTANAMFSIEEIEILMDESTEAIEKQKEISAIVSGYSDAEAENDVLEELEALSREDIPVEITRLPDVPSDEVLDKNVKTTRVKKDVEVEPQLST